MRIATWTLALIIGCAFACSEGEYYGDGGPPGADGDVDGDGDTDADSDSDTDVDTDGDTDDVEICDDVDNDSDDATDEGCDDDSDDWCDIEMDVVDDPETCPEGHYDCDDEHPDIYPGSTVHQEGVDYDCDNRREFMSTITIVVDDAYPRLCVNDEDVATDITSWSDRRAETYQWVMESGMNVLGIMGEDELGVVSAAQAVVRVNGREIRTDGVTEGDPDATAWRYFPTAGDDPHVSWCAATFDDSEWGPAITAAEYEDDVWLQGVPELRRRYVDWIWDGNPGDLANSWFRRRIELPDEEPLSDPPADPPVCALLDDPLILNTDPERQGYSPDVISNGAELGIAWDEWVAGSWGTAELELHFVRAAFDGTLLSTAERLTNAAWWSSQASLTWTGSEYAVAWMESLNDRDYDEIYFARIDATGLLVTGSEVRAIQHAAAWQKAPSMVALASGFGLSWYGTYNGNREIYYATLDAAGAHLTADEVRITSSTGTSRNPSLASTGTGYGVAWEDTRDDDREIYFQLLAADGTPIDTAIRVTTATGESAEPALIWAATRFALTWRDERDGNAEIYFVFIEDDATVGAEVRVTADQAVSAQPSLAWNGTEYAIAYRDGRSGADEIFVSRLDAGGVKIGDDDQVTFTGVPSWEPDVTFATGDSYGLAWEETGLDSSSIEIFRAAFGILDCGS